MIAKPMPSGRLRGIGMIQCRSVSLSIQLMLVASVMCLAPLQAKALGDEPPRPHVPVTVDPRVELLSIVFRLAGNPEYNKGSVPSYTKSVDERFGEFRTHPVVELAQKLRSTRGVSYDAVMSMATHVTDAYTLKEKVPFDPHPVGLDGRWHIDEAREFLIEARRFVKETGFESFIKEHQPLYDVAIKGMQKVLDKEGHLDWFDKFFGARPGASFTVTLGMLNGGNCYGARIKTADETEELYCVLGVWSTDSRGRPRFDGSMLETVVHEFCHSYTNPIVDRHEAKLKGAGELLYPHVAAAMQGQAYGNWQTMMRESFVRACVVRYVLAYKGKRTAKRQIRAEEGKQFFWIKGLSELLGEYETQREQYPTLDSFIPEIVSFFEEYAPGFAEEKSALAKNAPQVVSLLPANGAGNVDPNLKAIKITFDRPMLDRAWSVVGGGPNFPQLDGSVSYDRARKVFTIPVKLKANWSYEFWLNSDQYKSFQSQDRIPLEPVHVTFNTGDKR